MSATPERLILIAGNIGAGKISLSQINPFPVIPSERAQPSDEESLETPFPSTPQLAAEN